MRKTPLSNLPIDGDNGIIPFGGADDPTGGEEPTSGEPTTTAGETAGDQEDVRTCCAPSIEMAGGAGAVEGTEACLSECSYAACSVARDRFKELQTDPTSWADCFSAPITAQEKEDCKQRVIDSFIHFESVITDKFADCVASVQDESSNTEFFLGNPPCADGTIKTGCIVHASLDMTCNNVSILFDTNSGTCEGALHQPPVPTTRSCTIDVGGGQIRGNGDFVVADFTAGSAVTHYFDCGKTLCPFVLDGLQVDIDDIDDGVTYLTNLSAELLVAGYGQSDGTDMFFEAGALRVRVQGTMTDASGSAPFEAFGASSDLATGSHGSNLLSLGWVEFEAGGYNLQAYIEEAACD